LADNVEGEEDTSNLPIFIKIMNTLSLAELLAVMQGNLGAIGGLPNKIREVLYKDL
jgi:hypothetical protein